AGKILRHHRLFVEVDDKNFIVGIRRFHHGQRGGSYAVALVFHTHAVVDHETQRDRNILLAKDGDVLLNVVLIDGKGAFRQSFDDLPRGIEHGNIQRNQVRADLEYSLGSLFGLSGLSSTESGEQERKNGEAHRPALLHARGRERELHSRPRN